MNFEPHTADPGNDVFISTGHETAGSTLVMSPEAAAAYDAGRAAERQRWRALYDQALDIEELDLLLRDAGLLDGDGAS